jgi:hypothetical protein
VRLRAGRAKRQCDTVARWDLAGEDPRVVATEVFETVAKAGLSGGDKAWAEVMEIGATAPLRTMEIPRAELLDEAPNLSLGLEGMEGMPGMLGVLVNGLVATNGQLSSQLTAALSREHDTMLAHVNSTARATASETLLSWISENGMPGDQADGFGEAVKVLAPTLGPAIVVMLNKLTASMKAGKAAPAVETDGEKADRLLLEMTAIPVEVWMAEGRRQRVEVGLGMLSEGMEKWRREHAAYGG